MKFKKNDLIVSVSDGDPKMYDGDTDILCVTVTASDQIDVDRKDVMAWALSKADKKIAERLRSCISDGKVFKTYTIESDMDGDTYINTWPVEYFRGRYMNSSLKKLGY